MKIAENNYYHKSFYFNLALQKSYNSIMIFKHQDIIKDNKRNKYKMKYNKFSDLNSTELDLYDLLNQRFLDNELEKWLQDLHVN